MPFLSTLFTKKSILVTHNSRFHADDIFATATLSLLLGGAIKVVRTRDVNKITQGDYVYDVGGIYNPSINRFDHHQVGGAGTRENGVPYAAFGLVWKTYGEKVCGSKEVAEKIDESLVQSIDAHDNGVNTYTKVGEAGPYMIESMFGAFRPTWKEGEDYDTPFMELVEFAKKFLERKIIRTRDGLEATAYVEKAYQNAQNKHLIILDDDYPWNDEIMKYDEPLYVIWPTAGVWRLGCVRKEKESFENRKSLPKIWAGLRDEELVKVSGVADAVFCHNGRFLAVAKSKEGALALAEKALLA